jgi:hypothetical protein
MMRESDRDTPKFNVWSVRRKIVLRVAGPFVGWEQRAVRRLNKRGGLRALERNGYIIVEWERWNQERAPEMSCNRFR